jgi:hypothetical protein
VIFPIFCSPQKSKKYEHIKTRGPELIKITDFSESAFSTKIKKYENIKSHCLELIKITDFSDLFTIWRTALGANERFYFFFEKHKSYCLERTKRPLFPEFPTF